MDRRTSISAWLTNRRWSFANGVLLSLHFCAAWTVPAGIFAAESDKNLFRLFNLSSTNSVQSTPHPAVVRVNVQEGKALASGSGSLVGARDQYGLVVTNWHVVRGATGKIEVVFPDSFRSAATVLKTDEDWDLAALLVWRTRVTPLKISHQAPKPGDVLTIAGYGQGDYRAISGKCTQYVAPSEKLPFEIVELSVQARQGDSGGPILNDRGELAGVLFGASRGSTSGSYCERVRTFLAQAWPYIDSVHSTPQVNTPLVGFDSSAPLQPPPPFTGADETPMVTPVQTPLVSNTPTQTPLVTVNRPDTTTQDSPSYDPVEEQPPPVVVANIPPPPQRSRASSDPNWDALFGETNWDRGKTVLAIIGLLTVWGHVARMMTK